MADANITGNDAPQETVNTEPLIGSTNGWAIPSGATSARIDAHRIGAAVETNYGLYGVLHVLNAHRESVVDGNQPLLSENIHAALFNAALSLTARLEYMLEDWADKTDPNNPPAKG